MKENLKTRIKKAKSIAKKIRQKGFSAKVVQRQRDNYEPIIRVK